MNTNIIGIELEQEYSSYDYIPSTWADDPLIFDVVSDGSLRGSGREYVSKPLDMTQYALARDTIANVVEARHTPSHRTSTHIHSNLEGLTEKQRNAVILLAVIMGMPMSDTFGADRKHTTFCRCAAYSMLHPTQSGNKYYDVNYSRYGTIEYRMFPAAKTMHALDSWVNCVRRIHSLGRKIGSIEKLVDVISRYGLGRVIKAVIPSAVPRASDVRLYKDAMEHALMVHVTSVSYETLD